MALAGSHAALICASIQKCFHSWRRKVQSRTDFDAQHLAGCEIKVEVIEVDPHKILISTLFSVPNFQNAYRDHAKRKGKGEKT